jgi:hypothetical protein
MSAAELRQTILAGEAPVDPAAVDAAFSGLWRQAVERMGGANSHVVRACLWNLVAHVPVQAAPGEEPERVVRLLEQVIPAVPSRVIRLQTLPPSQAPAAGVEVQARVRTHCLPGPGVGGTVCAEEVDLSGYGAAGEFHFPALVRALRVPDLPMALLWLNALPREGTLLEQLIADSDRIVVDSHFLTGEGDLMRLLEVVRKARLSFADLGWMRLTPARYLIAKLFDPPGQAEKLQALEGIRVETTPDGRNEGVLLLGWLLSRCGYREFKAEAAPAGHRWRVRRGNRSFPVEMTTRGDFAGFDYDGILSLAIQAGNERYTLDQVDQEHVALDSPHHRHHKVALHGWEDSELVVAALGSGEADAVYGDALAVATGLMETEAWNR